MNYLTGGGFQAFTFEAVKVCDLCSGEKDLRAGKKQDVWFQYLSLTH